MIRKAINAALGFVVLALVWVFLPRFGVIDKSFFSELSVLLKHIFQLVQTRQFWIYVGSTTRTRALGLLVATVFGIILGLIISLVPGARKSTLSTIKFLRPIPSVALKCLAGPLAPTSGSVKLNGIGITAPPEEMAVVFQEYGRSLFPWMTVRKNVELPLKECKIPSIEREALVTGALESVGLADAAQSYPWQLSGGMQQRVAIARAVAYQPKLLLMDESFASVAAQTRADLEELMHRLWREHSLVVLLVTHDIDEAVYLRGRVLLLSLPTFVLDDVSVDLLEPRNQAETRGDPQFIKLRGRLYQGIQRAKFTATTGAGKA